jgi:hypothetical protein
MLVFPQHKKPTRQGWGGVDRSLQQLKLNINQVENP